LKIFNIMANYLYNKQFKFTTEDEKINAHISILDKNRNSRQIKIDLFIHHLYKVSKNLTTLKAQLKPNHNRILIHIHKHFAYIINQVMVVLFRHYSSNSIDHFFSIPQHTYLIGLSNEIVIQTIIESIAIVIELLKQLYILHPNGYF
jgi:hypothetical protein